MFDFCQADDRVDVEVEFDEHVPVTITYPEYRRLLKPPLYVTYSQDNALLDLKFSPFSRRLVEAVLVNAPYVRYEGDSSPPASDDETLTLCLWASTLAPLRNGA